MAYLERRRLTFFDYKENTDCGKIAEAVGKARVTSCASGYGLIVLGDSSGNVHIVNKPFEVRTFQAYNISVTLTEQSRTCPYLVTIGEDGGGINPLVKVWHVEKVDKNDMPVCLKIIKASIPNHAVVPTCLTILNNVTMMAVGFNDGSILLYRGDVKRERSIKQTVLQVCGQNQASSLTGLALYQNKKSISLYASTVNSTEMFDVSHKDKEKQVTLDDEAGCSLRCSVLAENEDEKYYFVARKKAVFCYTNGNLGPCYAVDGEKFLLQWFCGYLVIVSKDYQTNLTLGHAHQSRDAGQIPYVITILDTLNNITAYHSQLFDVMAVIVEWGSIYVLSTDNSLSIIAEKDLQSKLTLLFKKNLYDVAIKVAKYNQYDSDGLMEIFRQYGDYLYSKGDHKGAIEQYIKTIGKLEPSYVIRKYMGSQQVENLTTYLQALHKEGVANGGHTTLLLNFYTKLNKPQLLKEFIMTKDRDVDFDVEVAIDVCRHVSSEDALLLAEKHSRHDWYLTIQIEDQKNYKDALNYIAKLPFMEAENMMKKYGITLLEHEPKETTNFLIRLCTDYKPSDEPLVDNNSLNGYLYREMNHSSPESFIHYFLSNSEMLVEFLENLIQKSSQFSPQIYTTLLEHYLEVWSVQKGHSKNIYDGKIMRLFELMELASEKQDLTNEKLQALVLCKAADFKSGLLYLYEQNKMFKAIMKYHLNGKDYDSLVAFCKRFEHQEPNLWVQALSSVVTHENLPQGILSTILNAIERGNLLSTLLVIDALSHTQYIQLKNVRDYLKKILDNETLTLNKQQQDVEKFRKEIGEIEKTIESYKTMPAIFQASRCGICNNQLELPTVHFLCQHSFHQHCIESFAEHENECPACLERNKQTVKAIKSQEENTDLHEIFHSQLEHAEDGFSLVADYLGRGVFTKLNNFMDAEMNMLVQFIVKGYNQTNDHRGETIYEPKLNTSSNIASSHPQGTASVNVNPFGDYSDEEDTQTTKRNDDAKVSSNPFGDYDGDDETEMDDYDKNLNPFM